MRRTPPRSKAIREAHKKSFVSQWAGFEKQPEGALLQQEIDLSPRMGVAYERSVGFHKDFHCHDRAMLVCPRGATRMAVEVLPNNQRFEVDARTILVLPAGMRHNDRSLTSIYDTMALYPSRELLDENAPPTALNLSQAKLIKRSVWLEELVQRFFIERRAQGPAINSVLHHLSVLILMETLRLYHNDTPQHDPSQASGDQGLATQILSYVEANLFQTMSVAELCIRFRTTKPTFIKAFKDSYGMTPYAYIKTRRLEEAYRLLQGPDHTVGDVCAIVGYEDMSSFAKSFKSRYGVEPSSLLRGRPSSKSQKN
jgi:AraC-like DNA-binding protein/uncharacterized protein YjlB